MFTFAGSNEALSPYYNIIVLDTYRDVELAVLG